MLLSIIIVHFNQTKFLVSCLKSIKKAGLNFCFEVIVVDNHSKTSPFPEIKNIRFSHFKLIQNKKNLGLSKAVNQGIRISQGKYILILNPDILVHPNSIETLISFLEKNLRAGLVGPRLVYANGKLQYSARRYPSPLTLVLNRIFLGKTRWGKKKLDYYFLKDKDLTKPLPVHWVLGAALMVRRAAIEDVGPMNEKFFLYFEDVDWAYRFWQKGWEVWYLPQSKMTHFYQRLSARRPFFLNLFSRIFWIHLSSAFKFFLAGDSPPPA